MAFPTSNVSTVNLSTSSADPSLARADLLSAVQKLNTIIDEADQAQGVVTLDTTGRIRSSQIPNAIGVTGDQIFAPSTGVVSIQSVLRLPALSQAQITATAANVGDIAFCSNLTSYSPDYGPAIMFYVGSGSTTGWYALPMTSLAQI